MLCAQYLLLSHEAGAAGTHLDSAEALLGRAARARDRAEVMVERARWAAQMEEPEAALANADEALALLGEDDPEVMGRARWARGEALGLLGDFGAALDELTEAEQLLADDPRKLSHILQVAASLSGAAT